MDKLAKVRAAVERLHKEYRRKEGAWHYRKALRTVLFLIDTMQEDPVSEPQVKESAKIQHVDETCKENSNSLTQEPVSEDLWETSKQYALRQVLASTDTKMCEQAYLDLRLFSGLDLAVAHKDGAQWQKEQFEKNRLAACDRQTEEEAEIERDFVMGIIENEHRQPTFDDAIKYGMRLQKEQMMKEPNLSGYVARDEDGNLHIFEVEPRRLEEEHRWWDRDYNCRIIDNNAFPDLRWEDEPICVKVIVIKED